MPGETICKIKPCHDVVLRHLYEPSQAFRISGKKKVQSENQVDGQLDRNEDFLLCSIQGEERTKIESDETAIIR